MRLIDRYILRHVGLAFLLTLIVLTLLVWLVISLRQLNLLTTQGQSLIVFGAISSLALPSLIVTIAPIALFIAILWSLNRLNGDSELAVMNSAGISPQRLLVPYGALTLIVAAVIGLMTIYLLPASQRELRVWLVKVGADVISRMVQPGQFTEVRPGITVHVREKTPNGGLLGVFVQDASNTQQTLTYIAERGQIIEETNSGSGKNGLFLILEKGSVQRQTERSDADSTIVVFETYAFDLSQLIEEPDVAFTKPRERYTGELLALLSSPDKQLRSSGEVGRVRAELVDRLTAPLYPIAFALVAIAALGQARTTRQGRAGALTGAVIAVLIVRILGFHFTSALSQRSAFFGPALSVFLPLVVSVGALLIIYGVWRASPPAMVADAIRSLGERIRGHLPIPQDGQR